MPEDVLEAAQKLLQLLNAIERQSAYLDAAAVQEAKRLYYLLAPVHQYIGNMPMFETERVPGRVWLTRARERASQAVALIEAGLVSRVRPPEETWARRDLPILQAVATAEATGDLLNFDGVIEATKLSPTDAEVGLRALLDGALVTGIDATTFGGFDVLELRPTSSGRRIVGTWPSQQNGTTLPELGEPESDPLVGTHEYEYDVAVSYSGDDREVVEEVVQALKDHEIRVWYDRDQSARLWGEDLSDLLADVYANKARYVMVFLSETYTERDWTTFELEIAQAAARSRQTAYVLPVIVSEVVPPVVGLKRTVGFVSLVDKDAGEVAALLAEKLRGTQ